MKRGVLILCLLLAIVGGILGCGKTRNIKPRPSDEELAKASRVCGIVREIDDNAIKVQICGNIFEGKSGYCYIEIENEYDITEGKSVLLYYTGRINFEEKDTYIEAKDIEVCYMESYENEGVFKANLTVAGMASDEKGVEYSADDPRSAAFLHIKSLEDEPECDFVVKYLNNGENDIKISLEDEYLDLSEVFIITYDIDTMEVIAITQ